MKLPKQAEEHINSRRVKTKEAWRMKTQEEKNLQTSLFINNNPSYKIQKCEYCNREVKGASPFKRFHGENCKMSKNNNTIKKI